jgi:hypothetical protein
MTEDNKSPNKTQPSTSQTQTQNSQSRKKLSTTGVLGSKYLASEEEHRKFANAHPGEIVFGFGIGDKSKE